jgi:tetratricopeptide (TPR) repeat protein
MRFRLLSVMWGENFVDCFLRITLRSLIAPGNLTDIASRFSVGYTLYTTSADAIRIRNHPVYLETSKYVHFDFQVFSLREIDPKNSSSHWILWNRGVDRARRLDECVITVAPDHIFSRGTLSHWCNFFERGHLAIFTPGIQVALETVEAEFKEKYASQLVIDLDESDFKQLMFRHLHPVNITMFRGSPRGMRHPEYHLRAVPGIGFTQNIIASHAVAFRPAEIRMDESFRPTEKFDRIVFDPCRFLSAEPLFKLLSSYYHPWRLCDPEWGHIGAWADTFMTPCNWRESEITHVYSLDSEFPQEERQRAELEAKFCVRQVRASWAVFRLWRLLHNAGLTQAARWLAAGQICHRLRRRVALPARSTVFVPSDSAFDRIPDAVTKNLLRGQGQALMAEFREHLAPSHHALTPGDWLTESQQGSLATLSGKRYTRARTGSICILHGPLRIDELEVYVVDRPLGTTPLKPPQSATFVLKAVRASRHSLLRAISASRQVVFDFLRKNHRLYLLARRIRDALRARARANNSLNHMDESRAASIQLFRQALALRALVAISDLYNFYQAQVLTKTSIRVAPAEWISKIMTEGKKAEAATLLEAAVLRSPEFTEAWLELGYARAEHGATTEALAAFKTASSLPPTLPQGLEDPLLRSLAASAQLDLFAKTDQLFQAFNDSQPISKKGLDWTGHLQCGKALLKIGDLNGALSEFEYCMRQDRIASRFAKLLPCKLHEIEKMLSL